MSINNKYDENGNGNGWLANAISRLMAAGMPRMIDNGPNREIIAGESFKHFTIDHPKKFQPLTSLGSIESICDSVKRYMTPTSASIRVGRNGITVKMAISEYEQDAIYISAPFWTADMPGERMNYEQLIQVLDQNAGRVTGRVGDNTIEESDLRERLKMIVFSKSEKTTVVDDGPAISVTVEQTANIKPLSAIFPKVIEIKIRYGLREYLIPRRFLFKIKSTQEFSLIPMNNDGAVEMFINRALTDLKTNLGDEWLIVEGD